MAQPQKYEVDDCRDSRASVLAAHPQKGSETRKALIMGTGPIAHRNVPLPKQALSPAVRRVSVLVPRPRGLAARMFSPEPHDPTKFTCAELPVTFVAPAVRPEHPANRSTVPSTPETATRRRRPTQRLVRNSTPG